MMKTFLYLFYSIVEGKSSFRVYCWRNNEMRIGLAILFFFLLTDLLNIKHEM